MSNNKRGALLPAVLDPGETVCVSFEIPNTPEYRDATAWVVHQLSKWYHWQKDGTTRATDAARLFARLLLETYTVGNCCCDDQTTLLQQILQQTTNNYTLNLLTQEQTYLSEYNSYWNNAETDIYTTYTLAPTVTLTEGTAEPEVEARREDALCYVVAKFVDGIYQEIKQKKADDQQLANIVTGALGVIAAIGAFFTAGASLYFWMGVGAGVGALAANTLAAIEDNDLNDQTVQDEIACELKSALSTVDPTAASIKDAADTIRGAQPPNNRYDKMSNAVADVIAAMPDAALVNGLLANLSEVTDPAAGSLPACDCAEAPPTQALLMIATRWRIGSGAWNNVNSANDGDFISQNLPIGVAFEIEGISIPGFVFATIGSCAASVHPDITLTVNSATSIVNYGGGCANLPNGSNGTQLTAQQTNIYASGTVTVIIESAV